MLRNRVPGDMFEAIDHEFLVCKRRGRSYGAQPNRGHTAMGTELF